MSSLNTLKQVISRLGPFGTLDLVWRKIQRRARYKSMVRAVPYSKLTASLRGVDGVELGTISEEEKATTLSRAEAMLRDENLFFTFPYVTRGIDRAWEFDPLEKKYWPQRHYTEQKLHAKDTPRDVKIVWEINRFKDLPTLGQAALITKDKRFADEVERRILSWKKDNPFGKTINWASALEISIRLLSWTSTLALLRAAGFETRSNPKIARSVFEQLAYLSGDLSTDKVVPTNHLIGEVAGLYVVSVFWNFPVGRKAAEEARKILEEEILRQTFPDGATREATSWYHQFVTHFFELAERVALREGRPMSEAFSDRLAKMKTYLDAMTYKGEVVRYGDADDGWALYFEGNLVEWKSLLFGEPHSFPASAGTYFPNADQYAVQYKDSFLFIRAGEFGMGGAGSSSHAHDDFLSPIVFVNGLPVLADPGTFVYNGDREGRAKFRDGEAHNGLLIGPKSGAIQRMNFGWHQVRPNAHFLSNERSDEGASAIGRYGEWPLHSRYVKIRANDFILVDTFDHKPNAGCEWRLHLHPIWRHEGTPNENTYGFSTVSGDKMTITLRGTFETRAVELYDFSPSYRVERPGIMLCLTASDPLGTFEIKLRVNHHTE